MNYYRNVDDAISDPDLIMERYHIGRSIFFEVELTLAEFSGSLQSGSGGLQGNPSLIASQGLESNTGFGDVPGGLLPCPELSQYTLATIGKDYPEMFSWRRISENWGDIKLYNPISGNFNRISSLEIQEVDLVKITTDKKIQNKVSIFHKIIKNTADRLGSKMEIGSEFLTGAYEDKLVRSEVFLYQDKLVEIENIGRGYVAKTSLESEYIYTISEDKISFTLAHNRKADEDIIFL